MVIDNIIVGESLYDDARLDAIDSRNEKRNVTPEIASLLQLSDILK